MGSYESHAHLCKPLYKSSGVKELLISLPSLETEWNEGTTKNCIRSAMIKATPFTTERLILEIVTKTWEQIVGN